MAEKQKLGKLERVPMTKIWAKEDKDFTPWLQANTWLLEETLGFRLPELQREKQAGPFRVDLYGKSGEGNIMLIENQFGKSDHDHLGKLLTYMASMEARTAIWIVEKPRLEHVKAVSWFNDNSSNSFYLVKIEAVHIGDSAYAPLLTLIAGPSETRDTTIVIKNELTETESEHVDFWTRLVARLKERGIEAHSHINANKNNWLGMGAGKSGVSFDYGITKKSSRIVLYIDTGDATRNLAIYRSLLESKHEIEQAIGQTLDWQELEGKQSCYIGRPVTEFGLEVKSRWPELQDKLIDAMQVFIKALQPHIDALKE